VIDGKDIWPVLSSQPGARSPHDRFFYYHRNQLRAVRSGPWKYHQVLPAAPDQDDPAKAPSTALYHLVTDIGETYDPSSEYPEVVERLKGYLKAFEDELGKGDTLSGNCRPAGWVDSPKPLSLESSSK
jgi:hypothetical protein